MGKDKDYSDYSDHIVMEDDDGGVASGYDGYGFVNYESNTIDPSPYAFWITLTLGLILYLCLPLVLALAQERRKQLRLRGKGSHRGFGAGRRRPLPGYRLRQLFTGKKKDPATIDGDGLLRDDNPPDGNENGSSRRSLHDSFPMRLSRSATNFVTQYMSNDTDSNANGRNSPNRKQKKKSTGDGNDTDDDTYLMTLPDEFDDDDYSDDNSSTGGGDVGGDAYGLNNQPSDELLMDQLNQEDDELYFTLPGRSRRLNVRDTRRLSSLSKVVKSIFKPTNIFHSHIMDDGDYDYPHEVPRPKYDTTVVEQDGSTSTYLNYKIKDGNQQMIKKKMVVEGRRTSDMTTTIQEQDEPTNNNIFQLLYDEVDGQRQNNRIVRIMRENAKNDKNQNVVKRSRSAGSSYVAPTQSSTTTGGEQPDKPSNEEDEEESNILFEPKFLQDKGKKSLQFDSTKDLSSYPQIDVTLGTLGNKHSPCRGRFGDRGGSPTNPNYNNGIELQQPVNRRRPWYMFYFTKPFLRKIRKCALYDEEMEEICRLAVPYTLESIFGYLLSILEIAIISKLIGTNELSAYYAVGFVMSLSTMFMDGYFSSLTTLCSQAVGGEQIVLAGQYVQLAILVYELYLIPVMILWYNALPVLLHRIGYSETITSIAYDYFLVYLPYAMISPFSSGIQYLTDITGLQKYNATLNTIHSTTSCVCVFFLALVKKGNDNDEDNVTLQMVGMVHVVLLVLFFFINVAIILYNGWLQGGYWQGLVCTIAPLNIKAVQTLTSTAIPLSFGYIMSYSEWEILFLFASYLGPAEVAVWGIVGTLWGAIEGIGLQASNAAEVRVGKLLGSGNYKRARYSAHKSLFLGMVLSIGMAILVGIFAKQIPTWVTNDETLQHMIGDILPLFCVGNVVLTFGSMSWTILGSQGRYSLATMVGFVGSWVVTLPLAVISTFVFRFNVEGLIATVILGYAVSGFMNSFFLLNSNWHDISISVQESNGTTSKTEEEPATPAAGAAAAAVATTTADAVTSTSEDEDSTSSKKSRWRMKLRSMGGSLKRKMETEMVPTPSTPPYQELSDV